MKVPKGGRKALCTAFRYEIPTLHIPKAAQAFACAVSAF